jgi:hypothetical protein
MSRNIKKPTGNLGVDSAEALNERLGTDILLRRIHSQRAKSIIERHLLHILQSRLAQQRFHLVRDVNVHAERLRRPDLQRSLLLQLREIVRNWCF